MTTCAVNECFDTPFLRHPIRLCRSHALMVSLNITDILHANALGPRAATDDATEKAVLAASHVWEENSHPAVVYFLINGDRVKIGTSTNVTARVTALSLRKSNAALLLEGGYDLEDALHNRFEADRIGRTEWFVISDQIRDYIARRQVADATLLQPQIPTDVVDQPRLSARRQKGPTAEETIISTLRNSDMTYTDRGELLATTGLKEGTFANALGKLETAGKIHRIAEGKSVRVALGRPVDGDAAA